MFFCQNRVSDISDKRSYNLSKSAEDTHIVDRVHSPVNQDREERIRESTTNTLIKPLASGFCGTYLSLSLWD